jgi:putative ABC transport system ATP-binding protein
MSDHFSDHFSDLIVNIKNLNHYFRQSQDLPETQVLFDINLQIRAGEVVVMAGPSGSGKTTLLSLIGGLRSVQKGSLQIVGQELRGASSEDLVQIRRQIGFIFQGHNLLEFLSAKQNVMIALELAPSISESKAEKMAIEALQAVKLANQIQSYPNQLSGGQKQRVAIARALVGQPQLVLADEPTASLDSKTGRDVVELMHSLAKKQGCAVLLVTHDNRILDFADRQVHMEDGRLQSEVLV